MSLRRIELPSLGRSLSSLMAAPSSADATSHEAGLEAYYRLGGDCLHLHGEGGETHGKRAAGEWLRNRRLRQEFFLCTQICHEGWDDEARRPVVRFTPDGVREDVATDLALLGTDYLDLVYLDDNPSLPFEPVIDAIGREIGCGRVRAFGIRNWTADRIDAACAYASGVAPPGVSALFTTELALPVATRPLWPEYVPFDAAIQRAVQEHGLAVFAHANDVTLGQTLFGEEDATARLRPEWMQRWEHPANAALVQRVGDLAAARGATPRELNVAWLLNQALPVVAVISLPALLTNLSVQYERAVQLRLDAADLNSLNGVRPTIEMVSD